VGVVGTDSVVLGVGGTVPQIGVRINVKKGRSAMNGGEGEGKDEHRVVERWL
jgi:hypothetical protein